MANPEHLAKLKKGVEEWNTWRNSNLTVVPDLGGANLALANLIGANLGEANLALANLYRADLYGANLGEADLGEADLGGANLSGVELGETVFGDTNLKDVQGLDACHHSGPSILDHRTLVKSAPIPLPFLRGCGLPDQYIEYLPALLNQAIEFYSCFNSYSTKDQASRNGFMPTCKTRASAAGSLRTISKAVRRFTSKLMKRYASTTGCC